MTKNQSVLPRATLSILAVTQVISWGSIYYAFAILSGDIGSDLGLRPAVVFGAYSWSLLVAGVLATPVGAMLDRFGGRVPMAAGSVVAASGLALLAEADSLAVYWLAWTVIGVAMALVLYEAAFATIQRSFPDGARRSIAVLTLFGGFASTLFWPLTHTLSTHVGWRDTMLIYAAVQLLLCAPLHALLPSATAGEHAARHGRSGSSLAEAIRHPVFWRLAAAFAANSCVFSALTVHLIPLMHSMGLAMGTAVGFAAVIGPMQVAGRMGEMALARRIRPQALGAVIFALVPLALALLLLTRSHAWAAAGFCVLYGLSNGIMTIVRGTLPAALFGTRHYGAIAGALAGPSLLFKAAGPLLAAWIIGSDPRGTTVLSVLVLIAVAALGFYLAAIRSQDGLRQATA